MTYSPGLVPNAIERTKGEDWMARKTHAEVKRLLGKLGKHGLGERVYLKVEKPGEGTCSIRITVKGERKPSEFGLGSTRHQSLGEIYAKADEAIRKAKAGINPREERRVARLAEAAEKEDRTFRRAHCDYVAAHQMEWRNAKHRQQWIRTVEMFAYPTIGDTPVAAISVDDAVAMLRPIWGAKTETAIRLRGRCEAVWEAARARKWCTGENPFVWRGNLKPLLADPSKIRRVEHLAALPWQEVPSFVLDLTEQGGVTPRALELTILQVKRSGETRGMRWGEIDWGAKVWTIPGERTKSGRPHREPLTDAALSILEQARAWQSTDPPDRNALVFPGRREGEPLSDMAFMTLLRRMGRGDLTAHGFRSSFRDWCAEATNFPRELAETALSHVLENKTEAAYQRNDLLEKRRALMTAWGTFCTQPPPEGDNVTELRRLSEVAA
jgi:integrase